MNDTTSIYNGRIEVRWWVNVEIMGMMSDSGRWGWVVDSYFRKFLDQGGWFRIWLNKLRVYFYVAP